MILTKSQLEKLRDRLAALGVRDTDFPDATTVSPSDYIAIVQDRKNKKIQISELLSPEMLPSLIVNIDVVDDWGLAEGQHDKALSANLGYELYEWQQSYQAVVVRDDLNGSNQSVDGAKALSAYQGWVLDNKIRNNLTPVPNLDTDDDSKALAASQGVRLKSLINDRPSLRKTSNQPETYLFTWSASQQGTEFYTKAGVDYLLAQGGGGGGATTLGGLADVDFLTNPPASGNILGYNGSQWIPVAQTTDTWRAIKINGSDFLSGANNTYPINFVGSGSTTITAGSNGQIIIESTGGTEPGPGGVGYIGVTPTKSSATVNDNLAGVNKIYFGDTRVSTTGVPFIEWDSVNNCFHFSSGLYSDSFVSAGGYNNAGGGGGGASYLYDLTDVNKVGSAVGRADGATAAQNNDVLTYSSSAGKWVAAPAQGGSGGAAVWGGIIGTLADQTDLKNALDAKPDTTSLAAIAFTPSITNLSDWPGIGTLDCNHTGDLTVSGTESFSGNIWLHKISKTGNWADLEGKPTFYNLTLGENNVVYAPKVYNPTGAAKTFTIDDLTNVIGGGNGAYIRIGLAKLRYNNNALYLEHATTSGTAITFSATGNVVAGA